MAPVPESHFLVEFALVVSIHFSRIVRPGTGHISEECPVVPVKIFHFPSPQSPCLPEATQDPDLGLRIAAYNPHWHAFFISIML